MKTRRTLASYAAIVLLLALFLIPPPPAQAGRIIGVDDGVSTPGQTDDAWFMKLSMMQRITVIIYAYDGLSFPIP